MKTFDPTKPVQTRDGRKARILCTDVNSNWPIVAVITDAGYDSVHCYSKSGELTFAHTNNIDLINIPKTYDIEVWVNVYANFEPSFYNTRESADVHCDPHDRIACICLKGQAKEGEGI